MNYTLDVLIEKHLDFKAKLDADQLSTVANYLVQTENKYYIYPMKDDMYLFQYKRKRWDGKLK